jgi:hypothetical protein
MSFLSRLTEGFASLAIPPPAGNKATLSHAYTADTFYDQDPLIQQIFTEISAMPIPPEWKDYYFANFKSEFAKQQAQRPSLIASEKLNGRTIPPLTLKIVLLNIRNPCFKARIRNMLASERVKIQYFLENGADEAEQASAKKASMQMFLIEIINGFSMHPADYVVDVNGLPIGARNSRAGFYSQPPPDGCNMPKSPDYVGGKRKTKQRKSKSKKRKTKKRVSKKYA